MYAIMFEFFSLIVITLM